MIHRKGFGWLTNFLKGRSSIQKPLWNTDIDNINVDIIKVIESEFDAIFYLNQYPDVAASKINPLHHYSEFGWKEGRNPNSSFNTTYYLRDNPDVLAAGIDPFWHFLVAGRNEGREPLPSEHPSVERHSEYTVCATEFSERYYLLTNPDVAAAGVSPLEHFLTTGWREGRDPNYQFSVRDYLERYDDVRAAEINPFWHYLVAGRAEGRDSFGNSDVKAIPKPVTLLSAELERRVIDSPARLSGDRSGLARLRTALHSAQGYHLTMSHDEFSANVGGVQLCLIRESDAVNQNFGEHVHLFPAQFLPAIVNTQRQIGVLLNKSYVGSFSAEDIISCFPEINLRSPTVAIHSLLGFNIDDIIRFISAARTNAIYYWIHDYSSICAGYTLMRNDWEFCNAPRIDSDACGICRYGEHRATHVDAHSRLFERFPIRLVAPSESAFNVWRKSTTLKPFRVEINPHCTFGSNINHVFNDNSTRTRIGFIGYPSTHKGWKVFKDIALGNSESTELEFFHFGRTPSPDLNVNFRYASADSENLNSTIDAISACNLDAVLSWSLWPETFCIAAYEAVAAGAALITNSNSGNVAAFVKESGYGLILNDESDLRSYLHSADIKAKIGALRPPFRRQILYSQMTVDLIQRDFPCE